MSKNNLTHVLIDYCLQVKIVHISPVADRIRENEAVKLIRLKEGLTKLTHAYSDFARKCAVVFDAQHVSISLTHLFNLKSVNRNVA